MNIYVSNDNNLLDSRSMMLDNSIFTMKHEQEKFLPDLRFQLNIAKAYKVKFGRKDNFILSN